jgi:hypothetical protein
MLRSEGAFARAAESLAAYLLLAVPPPEEGTEEGEQASTGDGEEEEGIEGGEEEGKDEEGEGPGGAEKEEEWTGALLAVAWALAAGLLWAVLAVGRAGLWLARTWVLPLAASLLGFGSWGAGSRGKGGEEAVAAEVAAFVPAFIGLSRAKYLGSSLQAE